MDILGLPVDVFVLILKFLESRGLLCCATVCSQWRDLALDIKWREHVVDWAYLLQALGPRKPCFDEDQDRWEPKHSSIKEAIASPGWRRLNELRKKVTRLRIETHLVSEDIDYLLKLHHAEEPPHHTFCPQLRELEVNVGDLESYEYDFIAGASLQQFRLNWVNDTGRPTRLVADTVENIALRSPMVEHLKLCTGCLLLEDLTVWWKQCELVEEEAGAVGSQVQQLPVLHILRIGTPGDQDGALKSYILQNTHMPQLRELTVDLQMLVSLHQLRIPLNTLEISWMSEPPTPATKFDRLVELTLDPLHVKTNEVRPLAEYLALLCPVVKHFETTPVHPYETLPGQSLPWYSTEEEQSNKEVMRTRFFEAQREDVVFQSVSEEPK
ncbi:hypothetical protein FS837_010963 [Tulasnella sp. UAMH 9824]|nr:hypothetical protein FS837_010963 [Tulasnella sp. UAMH 9824]